MAKSENQTLQVAVIIFAFIMIALSVATFYFFNQATSNLENQLAAEADEAKMDVDLKRMVEENQNLKENIIGVKRDMKYADIITETQKSLRRVSAATPDADGRKLLQASTVIVDSLHRTKGNVQAELKKNGVLVAENIADKNSSDERFKLRDEAFKRTEDASSAELDKYRDKDTKHVAERTRLTRKVQAGLGDVAAVKAEKVTAINELKTAIGKLERDLHDIKIKEYAAKNWNFDRPDGRIVSVNAKKNTVWINIGRSDELRLHIKFTVFKRGRDNVYKRQPKGAIEVTRFLGVTMAEARITSSEDADPILDGDVIFTPTWSPREPERFVLAGDFDVNGDKKPDNEIIHTLIRMSGGVVEDELTINTRYLLLGTRPENDARFKNLSEEAKRLGIRIMTLREFLDYSGTRDLIGQATSLDALTRNPDDLNDVLRNREGLKKDRFKQRVPPDGARRIEAGAKPKGTGGNTTQPPKRRKGFGGRTTQPPKRKGSAY